MVYVQQLNVFLVLKLSDFIWIVTCYQLPDKYLLFRYGNE